MRYHFALIFVVMVLSLASCKGAVRVDESGFPVSSLPPEKQEELAMTVYNRVLDETIPLTRQDSMPIIIEGYKEVMDNYPDSFQAEESYYRLMSIALRDYYPAKEDEAERLYREYFQRYPNPRIAEAMNSELAMFYYTNEKWQKLELFVIPFMKAFIQKKQYANSMYLFLYSEATFHQGKLDEATKGFKMLAKMRPGSNDAKIAKERLEQILMIRATHPSGKMPR